MPYDADLADRVRSALRAHDDRREVRMFGGLAFMVQDRMLVCVSGTGLLVRVAPGRDPALVGRPGAQRAEMGAGRSMGEGWIAVDAQVLSDEADLQVWLDEALAFHAAQRPPGV